MSHSKAFQDQFEATAKKIETLGNDPGAFEALDGEQGRQAVLARIAEIVDDTTGKYDLTTKGIAMLAWQSFQEHEMFEDMMDTLGVNDNA